MVENNNNEDQAKLEAERKRLFEEMMASVHRMNPSHRIIRESEELHKQAKESSNGAQEQANLQNERVKKIGLSALLVLAIWFVVRNITPSYDEENLLTNYWECLNSDAYNYNEIYENNCIGKSIKIDGFIISKDDNDFIVNKTQHGASFFDDDESYFVVSNQYFSIGEKIEVKGVFDSLRWLDKRAVIKSGHISKSELTESEKYFVESKAKLEKSRTIAVPRKDGAKYLEEWDTLIRNDVANRRNALEDAAVEHVRINTSGAIMADRYTMKDGRYIICTTKVLPSGPAVMECDGKP
ncbi:MAG: hypothetical protein ACXWTP_00880 [Methylosarcina sp.]